MTSPLQTRRASPQGLADDLAQFGDAVAIVAEGRSVTYQELDALVAARLERLGEVRRLVLLHAAHTSEAVVTYLAALRGRHPVILTASDDRRATAALIDAYDPDVVAEGAEVAPRRDGSAHTLHPDLALLLSTSGTTGTQKLVRLSHENLVANAHSIVAALGITALDRAITTLPMQYCYGLSVLNSHLLVGASVVLSDHSVVDPCFWDLARAHGATSFAGVPHTFELLDRIGFAGTELPELRYVTQAGGPMPSERVQRYARLAKANGFALFVMYGQTEATARIACLPPALAEANPAAIGIAVPGGELRLDDVDADGVGELVYRGPNVMLGYASCAADLAGGRDVTELRTGDLARAHCDLFEIVGRRSRFVKPLGVRVDLDDLERTLADDGIAAMCTGDDARVVVAVEDSADAAALRVALAERLRLPHHVVAVVPFPTLPRLVNGKADYAAIRAAAASQASEQIALAPLSAADAFRAVLHVDPRAEDTFVSLGGDSLSFVEMSIALEELIGALPANWHTLSVASLDALASPTAKPAAGAQVDTALIVRAVAIVLVVGTHSKLWFLQGGAHAMIALAGFNFARFQVSARSILRSVARIVVPSVALIGVMALLSPKYDWAHVLLVNDVAGREGALWSFWFIEAIVQTSLVLALLLAVPAVAAFERRRPLGAAYVVLAAGLLARFDVVPPPASHLVTWPHEVLWLFALGWVAARATTAMHRLAVTVIAFVCMPGFFGADARGYVVLAAIVAFTWLPTVRVPRPALRLVAPVAGASLYIYLTHLQLHGALRASFGAAVATVASLGFGVVVWRAAQRVEGVVVRQRWFGRVARASRTTGSMLNATTNKAGSAAMS